MGTYIEQFVDSLKDLPNDFHRTAALVGVLDKQAAEKNNCVEKTYEKLLGMATDGKKRSAEDFANVLRALRAEQKQCHSLLDDKVCLIDQASFFVTSFIQRLDIDLRRFEDELGPSALEEPEPGRQAGRRQGRRDASVVEGIMAQQKQQQMETEEDAFNQEEGEVYCYCRKGNIGPMIGCDNDECEIEWFHFKCVGLTAHPPEGVKWYCPDCNPNFV